VSGSLGTCTIYGNGTDPDNECTNPPADVCNGANACRCHDGVQNGTETQIDCGGTCGGCPLGSPCGTGTDCNSGFCTDGVCCNAACNGTCEACDLGGSVSACTPYAAGTDPETECNPDVCGGTSACRCSNGVQDGAETAIDCGGGTCNDCPQGSPCLVGSDCTTGFCADGLCCNTACGAACEGCDFPGSEGTCTVYAPGTDPDSECNNPPGDLCNGANACRCNDGSQNGSETDVDCGGATCNDCINGKTCLAGSAPTASAATPPVVQSARPVTLRAA